MQDEIKSALDGLKTSVLKRVDGIEIEVKDMGKVLAEVEKKIGRPPLGASDATHEQAEYHKAFDKYLRRGDDTGLAELQQKAMNSQTDPAGGYLILPEMDKTIDRIAPTVSAMYRLANVVTIGTAKYEKLVKTAGMAARRIADGSAGGESTEPTYAKLAIEVFPSEVEPWVNQETLQDSFVDLETDLANEAAIAFGELGGSEFITGNGVGKARGILSHTPVANASYSWGNVGYIATGKAAAFASVAPADAIVNLIGALPTQYRADAAFIMADATLNTIRQMKDGSGQYYLWQADATAAFGGRLLGFPVAVDNNMPAVGANAYAVAFGNWKRAYAIVNRTGTTLIRDPYTGKGVVKFNFRRRFGGGVLNFEAYRLLKFATG